MRGRSSEAFFISALGFGQICAWGTLYYSYPLIVEAMMPELGWQRAEAYAPATLGLVLAAFLTYPVGVAVDRGYGRALLGISSLLVAGLFLLWSLVETQAAFYVVATLLGALQACTLYEPAFAVLARRVGAGRARAGVTHITLWGGFASTVFIPLIQFFLDHWGWREALLMLAFVNLLLAGMYAWQIRPHDDRGIEAAQSEGAARDTERQIVRATLRNRVFWLLLVAMLAYAAAFSAFTFHMYPMLLEGGLSVAEVVTALAFIGPAQVGGRLVIGMLGERASMRRIGCFTVAVLPPVFLALLFFKGNPLIVIVLCCLYGAANGIFTIVRSLVVPEMITPHAYGALNGIINLPATLARAVAPWATAVLWGVGQSYESVLWAITATFTVLALAFWAAARQ
ncbi:MFS transporter [Yanghanlia caeni]|uniref:MFS transporter n=1 Tax=Yanghanlia caeni TaxID=3064283 RepID=A0ABU1D5U7_9BURK|nr:MFS transporter [Alcaligenaceae bacterium LG-2]